MPSTECDITDYVVTGLVKRRAEIAGQVEEVHKRLSKLLVDLESVDATIMQFDTGYVPEGIRPKAFRPSKDWSRRGHMVRFVLSILRQAKEPLTTRDIALELLISQALDRSDTNLLKLMIKRVGAALQMQAGRVRSLTGPGMWNLWEMVRDGDGNVPPDPTEETPYWLMDAVRAGRERTPR